ncbi:tRNA methyltransferase [Candidatus Dojkabacteria bacterium]|nr:tRNA methyltransferase [Candidatus Dojkabacteria bacterium]
MKQLRGIELKRFLKKNRQELETKEIVVIAENIQYARNVASLFRILDAVKAKRLILSGISQKPPFGKELQKVSRHKELSLPWEYQEHPGNEINKLKKQNYEILALEITDKVAHYAKREYPNKICIVIGNETYGITKGTLEKADSSVYLPMYGKGASLNVTMSLVVLCYHILNSNKE